MHSASANFTVLILCAVGASFIHAASSDGPGEQRAADSYQDITANIDADTAVKGEAVYDKLCASCHEQGLNRAPQRFILNQMAPESILRSMTDGVMKAQTQHLLHEEKVAVAEFLPSRKLGSSLQAAATLMCEGKAAQFDRSEVPVLRGWGMEPRNSHFIATDVAGIHRQNVASLKLRWALAFPNAVRARSQPAVAAGEIFVGSHDGTVYALDRATGCARWVFQAAAEVRTGIVIGAWQAQDDQADSGSCAGRFQRRVCARL
jgi:polyvinyl alcohol dehydrogenase (cytochrome)